MASATDAARIHHARRCTTPNQAANARRKLETKNLDWIVLNNLREDGAGFGTGTNRVTLLRRDGRTEDLPLMPKRALAEVLLRKLRLPSPEDDRVPLPYLWSVRFLNGGPFSGGTDLIVWRDIGTFHFGADCGSHPPWWPLPQFSVFARDESGSAASVTHLGQGTELFPLATQRVPVASLGVPYPFGRLVLSLGPGPEGHGFRQAWVQAVMSADGLYSVGLNARALTDLCGEAP